MIWFGKRYAQYRCICINFIWSVTLYVLYNFQSSKYRLVRRENKWISISLIHNLFISYVSSCISGWVGSKYKCKHALISSNQFIFHNLTSIIKNATYSFQVRYLTEEIEIMVKPLCSKWGKIEYLEKKSSFLKYNVWQIV